MHILEWTKCSSFVLRVDKKRDKIERKILDSQERAFWDVHRPVVSEMTDVAAVTVASGVTDILADIRDILFLQKGENV